MTLDKTDMLITFDLSWMLNFWTLAPYFLIGFGFGIAFYYMFYDKNSMTCSPIKLPKAIPIPLHPNAMIQ